MNLIEAILTGMQCKRLEKPFVFVAMLICFLAFSALGVVILLTGLEAQASSMNLAAALGSLFIAMVFFGLSAVCGYFIKKCVQ